MKSIKINTVDLIETCDLSFTYWLSKELSENSSHYLRDFAILEKFDAKSSSRSIQLDTSGGNNGLIQIINYRKSSSSKTHRKVLPPGYVAISRLRSYLRQVICFSEEVADALDIDYAIISSEFYVLKPVNCTPEKLTLYLLSDFSQKYFEDCTGGSHHPRFTESVLFDLPVNEAIWEKAGEMSESFGIQCANYARTQKNVSAILALN